MSHERAIEMLRSDNERLSDHMAWKSRELARLVKELAETQTDIENTRSKIAANETTIKVLEGVEE